MSPAVVLIVDDNDAGRFAKAQVLRRGGFTVVEAATGGQALDVVAHETPDVVVLDVHLPDINGFEVARRMRAGHPGATVPILQISATAVSAADHVLGLEHGADVYITEPVDSGVLVATVRALVRARLAESALATALANEKAARAAAEDANAVKTDFIATLSHELRTPLNALLGSVWQLQHTALDQAARSRALERIERSATAQARLVNDLLDLSRIAKGKLPLLLSMLDLGDILEESVDAVRPAALQRDVTIDVSTMAVPTIGDAARLQQVFVNLLTNSIQFTPECGRITVVMKTDGDQVVVRIDDTGAGIEAEFLPYVFEQFRQGEGGLSRKHGGLGLGLSVVRQLVELHDGRVMATSRGRGQGASFFVTLQRETILPGEITMPRLALAGIQIVIVSEDVASDTLAALEAAAGGHIVIVSSLDEAVACLSHVECDALLLAASATGDLLKTARDRRGKRPMILEIAENQRPVDAVRKTYRAISAVGWPHLSA